jgi:hypothetical protein
MMALAGAAQTNNSAAVKNAVGTLLADILMPDINADNLRASRAERRYYKPVV